VEVAAELPELSIPGRHVELRGDMVGLLRGIARRGLKPFEYSREVLS
jgi:hypothetical protein